MSSRLRPAQPAVAALLAAGLLLAGLLGGCGGGSPEGSAPTTAGSSSAGGFTVVANHVVGPTGETFVPYGFVVYCLSERHLSCERTSPTDSAKIKAAATYWHADTVRIQVAQENLFSQAPYDKSYLAAVGDEVRLANSLGMVAILTLQEEQWGGPPLPTASSVRFWSFMAQRYRNDRGVMFDLFNEPRLKVHVGGKRLWHIWQDGGRVDADGTSTAYVGMQTLVDTVRATGADNVVIAEGNSSDHNLSELTSHFLEGTNIAYGMEPDLKSKLDTPAEWNVAYGDLAGQVPIMMEAFQDYPTAGSCFPRSPTVLPRMLAYLKSKQLGLISWTMAPGIMIVGDDLDQPTSYAGASSQVCVAHNRHNRATVSGYRAATNSNGPGATILAWFRANSHDLPPAALTS